MTRTLPAFMLATLLAGCAHHPADPVMAAQERYERSGSVDHQLDLARTLAEAGDAEGARMHYGGVLAAGPGVPRTGEAPLTELYRAAAWERIVRVTQSLERDHERVLEEIEAYEARFGSITVPEAEIESARTRSLEALGQGDQPSSN